MKKKLEADLISIAHRILQLKNKSDINQLFLETQKLYEKLAVLRFVEEHFGDPKPTIGQAEVVEKMKEFFENIAIPEFQKPTEISVPITEETPVTEEVIEDTVIDSAEIETIKEPTIEIITEENNTPVEEVSAAEITPEPIEEPTIASEKLAFTPIIDAIEPIVPEKPKKKEAVQISFDDLLGTKYSDPQFVKVSPNDKKHQSETIKTEAKSITLNDKLVKEISIGLNDRIAFVKHLFGGSNEDYNRVVNQLITFDTFLETKTFIDEMVKPDYNNWEGKEDYEHRLMEIIEKKFLIF